MMGQLSYYIIFMNQTLKKFWIILFLVALMGCSSTPEEPAQEEAKADKFEDMHPEERHIWHPPSEAELEARRQRQKWLDVVAADLERLFMGFADIMGDEIILENLLRETEPELKQLEALLDQQRARQSEELARELKAMGDSVGEMKADLEKIRKDRKKQAARQVQKDEYRLAILLFRNGKYLRSIAVFKSILGKKFPARLKDNILFGLASNYFKLKQYDKALVPLKNIIRHHRKGDKWLVSHAMTGLIYNFQGNTLQAVKILESALRHQPKPELLKIINRLLKIARGGTVDASS